MVTKHDPKQIFASQAPEQDKPAQFNNYVRGWDESRKNNGKPTIKQFNKLQQLTDEKILWIHENGAALPYDETMDYAENAHVVKDGKLQQKKGDSWVNVGVSTAAELMDESGKTQQDINEKLPINFDLFNADATGLVPCDAQIIAAFNASRDQKRKLINTSGTYLLNGSQDIEISFDYDLSGTVFKLGSSFTGSIKITKNAITTRHTSGSVLTKLQSVGSIPAGKSNLTGVTSADGLDNQYVKFYFNQPMYTYRGVTTNRFELNRILKRGQLIGSFMYDVDFSLLTSVDLQPVSNTVLCGNGLTIDETSASKNLSIVKIDDGNGFDLRNFKFIDNASAVAANLKDKITLGLNAHDVRIDYVDTSATYINSLNEASYTVTMFENFSVELNHICSDGYGWGATGSNNCRRVSLKNSQLSRVDFHKPCHEWLKIDDCVIGNWGVLVTMLGDLTMTNVKFNMRSGYSNNGFIRSREDTGGFCNGKLTMNNITIEGDASVGVKALLRCQRTASNTIPAGSPIRPEFWTDIEINGINIKNYVVTPLIESNQGSNLALMLPKSIVLNHLYTDINTQLAINVHQFKKRDEGVRYVIDDSRLSYLPMFDTTGVGTKINATISGLRGLNAVDSVNVDNTCAGVFTFIDSNITKYREYSGGWSVGFPFVKFIGGELNNTTDTTYFDCQSASKNRIKLLGTRLNFGSNSAMQSDLHFFSSKGCTWNDADYFPLYSGDGTTGSATFAIPTSGDVTLIVKNNAGKVDVLTIDTQVAATLNLPNNTGTIVTAVGSNTSFTVTTPNLLSVGLVSS